ncbi:MAG: cell division protein FtsQ/DivIB [Caulobacterales bacterium]
MATMRGRRPPRKQPPPPPRRSSGTGVPRLATIKLDSQWRAPPKVTREHAARFSAATVLIAGAAIAGAAWLGGSLFDANQAFASQTDKTLAGMGFRASFDVQGATGAREAEVLAIATPENRHSLLAADPQEIKARVEGLEWVSRATVKRRWPGEIHIHVERRAAFARWQENGSVSVIDAAGERLLAERAADHPELPLVVGAGASHAAGELLRALEELPDVRERVVALVRVGERRWNLELASGATIELPERQPVMALTQLEELHAEHHILDRPVATLDMRMPGRLAVRGGAGLLGAHVEGV